MEDFRKKWEKCLAMIKAKIGAERFEHWFACAHPVSYDKRVLTIQLPSSFFVEIYESQFLEVLKSVLRSVYGPGVMLKYQYPVVRDDDSANIVVPSKHSAETRPAVKKGSRQRVIISPFESAHVSDIDSQLNESYNFENYCEGESNKLPLVIARHIADRPDHTEFNPFFLYGSVGVGKTHLIQAIGIRLKERNPNLKVLYVTFRQFQNQLGQAVIDKEVPSFISWYEKIDVLLIDDLQEISFHSGTMNVLFPIFNHLHQHNKKLIFTCDRPPMELDGVTDRLIDRFKWGVVEELPRPDFELRKKILSFKAAQNGLNLPEDVIDIIASRTDGSVREIEGVVMGMLTRSITLNRPITADLALSVMRHTVKPDTRVINFDMIVEATAEYYRLNPDVIFSKSRVRDIADARQLIMYLASKHTQLSSSVIGAKLNRRHATVLYGIKQIADRIPFSKELSDAVGSIEQTLQKMRS